MRIFRRQRLAHQYVDPDQLSFDEPPRIEERDCSGCGRHYPLVRAFVAKGDHAHAISYSALHAHDGVHEAWIDVILGSFRDDDYSDHVTFGCRVGPVQGQSEPAATAVQAAQPYGDRPLWGRKLSREDALTHERLSDFWEVVDFLLLTDPVIHHHVYGHEPSPS